MTSDAMQIVGALFSMIWRLFNSWYIPGTQMTPAALGFFLVSASIGLRFVLKVFGSDSSSAGHAVSNAKFIKSKVE